MNRLNKTESAVFLFSFRRFSLFLKDRFFEIIYTLQIKIGTRTTSVLAELATDVQVSLHSNGMLA